MMKGMFGRKNTIQSLQVLLAILGFTTLGAWMATQGRAEVIWTIRIGAPIGFVGVGFWLYKIMTRQDNLPDLLRKISDKYFERDGLCFMPVFETTSDHRSFISLYFQNRNSGHASAKVVLRPPGKSFWSRQPKLSPVCANIECPGGAFGVLRVPYPVAGAYHGRRVTFGIAADTRYRTGRGDLLRFRSGMRVGTSREIEPGYQMMRSLLMLFCGILYVSSPAHATLTVPTGVSDGSNSMPAEGVLEILWQPELPTRGFPIEVSRAAA